MRKLKLFLSLLTVMALSLGNVWGQAAKGTTLFSENFSGYAADAAPSGSVSSETGNRVVYGGGSVTYTSADNGSNITKIYSANIAGGTAPELLIGKSGGVFTIAGIPSGGAKEITVSFYQNAQKLTVSLNGTGYSTTYNSPKPTAAGLVSFDITVADGADDTFTLVFTASSSNVRFDDISIIVKTAGTPAACSNLVTITKGAETNGTYSLSATEICGDGDGGEVSITDISADDGYAFDEITTTNGTVDNENKKVTGITENTTITVTFKELQKYTVSFNTGAGNPAVSPIEEATAGAGITLPEGPTPACSADGWTFAGWAASKVGEETTTAPTLLSGNYNPTDNVTLYAVYKRTEEGGGVAFARYEKVTSNPSDWSGTYLLAANTAGTTYYTFTGMNGATAGASTELTPGTTEQTDYEVVVAKTTNGYSIYHTKGKVYLGLTSDGNNLNSNSSFTASNYEWTLSYNNGVQSVAYTARYIECNTSSSYKVACYKATQKRFYLYKRIEEAASTTYYLSAPSCCTKHSINIALGIQYGKVEADLTEACEGTEVTLTATPNEHCSFVKWDVKQGETPVTVTNNKFTMPDADVTVSATFEEIRNAVNVLNPGHGTISVTGADNLESVLEGTELSVEVSGAGYEFTLKAYKVGEESTIVPITDGKLTMPAYGIVITADEQKLVSPTILVSKDLIDFGTAVKDGAAPEAQTFTISGANLTGDLSLAWESADAYFAWEVTEGSLARNAGIVEATIRVNVTAKGMSVADTHMDNLIVSGGGATQKEVMVGVEVQQTYTAKWFVNGEELTESTQTAVAGTDLIAPSNPTKLADDCAEMVFKGWAEAAIEGKQDDAPAYTTKTQMPEADVNFYAVFAVEKENISKEEYQYTIPVSDFNTTSYAANNNEKTVNAVCTTDESKKLEVKYTSNQVMQAGSLIQGQKSTGYIYNAAAWGTKIKSITLNDNVNYTYVIGASAQPTETAEGAFFKISAGSSTSKATSIDIVFEVTNKSTSYIDFMTTCPTCQKVTLVKAGETNGSFTIKEDGVEVSRVKTCEAAELTVDATPATGYELTDLTISGVEGAAYNAGVISIPQDAAGTLTVTATFTAINYTVTMAQTGDAEAEISGNQESKHYGNEITVTAGEKAGYYFLGWAADVEVAFADAKAYETTFPMPASNVKVTAKYAKILSVAEALALIPNEDDTYNNAVVEAYVANVKSYSDTYKSIDYNIKDLDENGFGTETWMLVYGGKGMNGAECSSQDDIKNSAKVIIFGQLKNYKGTKEFSANSYLLLYEEAEYEGLRIYGEATNTEYEVGDKFSFAGLKAKHVFSNGYATPLEEPTWKADPYYIAATTTVVSVTATNGTLFSPAVNVPVTVKTHKVTITTPENGTLVVTDLNNTGDPVADGAKFVRNDELKIEAFAAAGYKLETLTVNGADFTNGDTYKVGTEDIVIEATFVKDSGTAIDNTEAGVKAVKLIENGVLIIRRGDKSFNAQGQLIR